jgi:nucleotide-binding universal stress UspA family protein
MAEVVVPLDGSPLSERALPFAVAMAAGGPVTLVTTKWDHDVVSARDYLEARAAELDIEDLETVVVMDRDPDDAILVTAHRHPGAIICMGTHGRSGLGEEVLGSVAEAVVRRAEPPVMLIGPEAEPRREDASTMLVAVDSAETSRSIILPAAAIAASLDLDLVVVHVGPPPPVPMAADADVPPLTGDGIALEAAADVLATSGLRGDARLVRGPDAARTICELARDVPTTYVVVGTHARHGLARVALGSVAMRVVRHAPCPVLVVRA